MMTCKTNSFFTTEFFEDYGAREMYDIFKEYGKVEELIIPMKREKRGKRYGFLKFQNIWDDKLFATKLDNIFIESKKLFANIPRFRRKAKDNNRKKYPSKRMENPKVKGQSTRASKQPEKVGANLSKRG